MRIDADLSSPQYVVAIDLGTSRTAYAWKSIVDPTPFVGVPDSRDGDPTAKSPTAVLVNGSRDPYTKKFAAEKIVAFGEAAEEHFAERRFPQAQFFKHFKMDIHQDAQYSFDDMLRHPAKSVSSAAEVLLEDLLTLTLRYIKDAVLAKLSSLSGVKAVTVNDVVWVLTVPVCCTAAASEFMKFCARAAGFVENGNDHGKSLVVCEEPIAACLALGPSLQWNLGEKYLVIDCGGGTVDISAFRVAHAQEGKLEQLGTCGGGKFGAKNIDEKFEKFVQNMIFSVVGNLGEHSKAAFESSTALWEIKQNWEQSKIRLADVHHDCRVNLFRLSGPPLNLSLQALDDARDRMNRNGTELVGGQGGWELAIRPPLMRKFFAGDCNRIKTAVKTVLSQPELAGLTAVVLVGGFSGSVHVREAIQECIRESPQRRVPIKVADNPALAVVQGAVHYSPFSATTQRGGSGNGPGWAKITARKSYGILTTRLDRAEVNISEPHYFHPFILMNEACSADFKVSLPYKVLAGIDVNIKVAICDKPDLHKGEIPIVENGVRLPLQDAEAFRVLADDLSDDLPDHLPDSLPGRPSRSSLCCFSSSVVDSVAAPPVRSSSSLHGARNTVDITIEFRIIGVDLHVQALARSGRVVGSQMVQFLAGGKQFQYPQA